MDTTTDSELDAPGADGSRRTRLRIGATVLILLFGGLASPRLVGAKVGSAPSVHARPSGAQVAQVSRLAGDDEEGDDDDEDNVDDTQVTQPTAGAASGDTAVAGTPSFTG
jgi:hypothetical protein